MDRRKISAKDAVADIRSGWNDAALMKKYGLSPNGLQSLFDKLVNTGFIDLGEMQNRLHGFLGSVVIPEADLSGQKDLVNAQPIKSKSARTINAQEVARDIRSGMNDSGLMEKYRLSPKGITSLFEKLISLGLLTQADCDRRRLGHDDHTIDLREDKLSLSDALMQLGINSRPSSAVEIENEPGQHTVVNDVANDNGERLSSANKENEPNPEERRSANPLEIAWYDRPIILMLVLLGIFPLGFYGLYQNRRMSVGIKACIVVGWFAAVTAWALVLSLTI